MELDKRIIEGKHPLTCFDTEQAQNFVGKKCYLTNDISIFSDLDSFKDTEGCSDAPYVGVIDRLTNINKELSMVFDTTFLRWKFCIPCEWVKPEEPEKKYRPFSLEEFFNIYEVGDLIVFKMKNTDEVKCAMFTGYITDVERIDDKTPGAVELMLGIFHYSLFSLFEDFELLYDGEWQPFGVIDE